MQPSLHNDVSRLLEPHNLVFEIYDVDEEITNVEEHNTNVMGEFACKNRACACNGWSSKKVATTIRMYLNEQCDARVYHQSCRSCKALSRPILDDSYADRVAYRLKKWSEIPVERLFTPARARVRTRTSCAKDVRTDVAVRALGGAGLEDVGADGVRLYHFHHNFRESY